MSEGTPGQGPDADSRTETGEGQASTNGRPVVPPVRYGPRNANAGSGAKGRDASNGRTTSGSSSPQQYRPPQPPRSPANGSGTNGSGSNGSGFNGAHPVTPNPYARPRPNGTARPEPSEQERLVTEARTAAAARNASAAKVRGGSAVTGTRSPAAPTTPAAGSSAPTAPVDETAVIPVVAPEKPTVAAPPEPARPSTATTQEAVAPDKGRTVLGRLRDGRDRRAPRDAEVAQAPEVAGVAEATTSAEPATSEQEVRTEPLADVAPEAAEQEPATEQRRLTWRDRLGLAPREPKEPKPEPVVSPETGSDGPVAEAAQATTTTSWPVAAEAKASPTGPSTAPQPEQAEQPADRVSPTALVPATTSDTVVIPAVEAGAGSPAGTAQALAPAKPKVGAARRTRKARLRLSRVDPWSVMKTALLFSIAAGIILVVATYGVWTVLNQSGLFDAVNDMVKSVVSTPGDTTPFRIEEYVNTQKIIGVAALIAVVDVLIFTALATLGSFLYNLAATVLGGLEVTLAED